MANAFNKEERVAFEQILQGFEDALVLSKLMDVYKTDQTMMERANDTIWRPQPYIAQSFAGTDQTSNFQDFTQLSVPATIGYNRSVPWFMNSLELRDSLQSGRLGDAAKQKLASDINEQAMTLATLEGTLVVTKSTAASGYADVAAIDAIMNRNGVQGFDRFLALSTFDYNGLAADLANRSTMTGKPTTAYERSRVGMVAGFDTFKLDIARRLTAAAGGAGLTVDTREPAANYYVPRATSEAATGEQSNVDNRRDTITISSTTSVAVGDCFTIAGVNEVHHITKADTGSLKTFRVMEVPSATTLVISPPIISNQGATAAEAQYQNCTVTTSATAAIVFLNTVTKSANPFWQKGAMELLPGRYAVPTDAGAAVMRSTTEQGIELVMQKQYDINTMRTKYRLDCRYGLVMLQPEMAGIALFSQT